MDALINKLTPGNYWLTKSMEFNRIGSSGTLWYLKKWITFYKFIFVYCIGGLLNSLTIFFLDKLQFQFTLSWFIGTGLAVMNNFLGSKFIVFKK